MSLLGAIVARASSSLQAPEDLHILNDGYARIDSFLC